MRTWRSGRICEMPECESPNYANGLCNKHPRLFTQIHGDHERRFWSTVDKTADCWLYLGTTTAEGYGTFSIRSKSRLAHRWAYELLVGPIPDGLQLDHLCRVPPCVNPAHLEPVTGRENTLRGVGPSAVNAVKTECTNGHPFDDANTHVDKRGRRSCRACNRENNRVYRQRMRERRLGSVA